jgi:hypothetical protein
MGFMAFDQETFGEGEAGAMIRTLAHSLRLLSFTEYESVTDRGRPLEWNLTLSKLSTDFGGRLGDTAEKIDRRPRRFPGETARGKADGREAPDVNGRDGPEGPAPRTGGDK